MISLRDWPFKTKGSIVCDSFSNIDPFSFYSLLSSIVITNRSRSLLVWVDETFYRFAYFHRLILIGVQLFQLRLSTSEVEKLNKSAESFLGIANKLMGLLATPSKPFAFVFDFSALLLDNLN